MSALFIALIGALVGGVVGGLVTWLLGAPDRAQAKKALQAQERALESQQKLLEAQQAAAAAQTTIAKLESEREQREFFNQFSPKVRFGFEYPNGNSLTLEANEPFIVESIDYLTSSGASVGSEEVGQSSKSVRIAIKKDYLSSAKSLGPNRNDPSGAVQFRVHILKDGMRKPHIVHAVARLEMIQTPHAQVQVLKLVG
jgi:multidrug efflux pump subunit AcrA (membrane-fusion protein)